MALDVQEDQKLTHYDLSTIKANLHPSTHWLLGSGRFLTDERIQQTQKISNLRLNPEVIGRIPVSTPTIGDVSDLAMRASGRYEGIVRHIVITPYSLKFKIESLVYLETFLAVEIPTTKVHPGLKTTNSSVTGRFHEGRYEGCVSKIEKTATHWVFDIQSRLFPEPHLHVKVLCDKIPIY